MSNVPPLERRAQGNFLPHPRYEPGQQSPRQNHETNHNSKGGGWVLMDECTSDPLLKHYADTHNLVVISVGYRLAPENPYPAPNEDCLDVGEYLVDHAKSAYNAPLLFLGGESAGAHLSVCTAFQLLRTRPSFAFRALVLSYGVYDLSGFLPQAHTLQNPAVLTLSTMTAFVEAYTPRTSPMERKNSAISPLYADLAALKLPPALFTCGTADILLDDTVLFGAKWAMAGGESVVKIYPGAPHGMTAFPLEPTEDAMRDTRVFMEGKM